MDWRFFSKALLLFALGVGCSAQRLKVRPDEREYLADRIMRPAADAQEAAAEQHILTTREGATGGSGTSGGGCGCN